MLHYKVLLSKHLQIRNGKSNWWRCGRNEHRSRSDCSKTHGNGFSEFLSLRMSAEPEIAFTVSHEEVLQAANKSNAKCD